MFLTIILIQNNILSRRDQFCNSQHRPAEGSSSTDLELRTDAGRFLLLVQVKQRLGDAVVESHAAQVTQRLDVQQMLRTYKKKVLKKII